MNQAMLKLPSRSEVAVDDTWDLSTLYASDESWYSQLDELSGQLAGYEQYQGRLADSPEVLAECLRFDSSLDRIAERLGNYAYLKTTEDQSNGDYQAMMAKFQNVATRAAEAQSFMRPEILAIDDAKLQEFLAHGSVEPYRLMLDRLLRYKPHTLSSREEEIIAMQGEMAGAVNKVFRQLTDSDMKFGEIANEDGLQVELTQSTFSQFLISPDREVRRSAFHQFYDEFADHENTLAAALAGSIQKDVYYARVRGYDSALGKALFADKVPVDVYDNLISTVRENLPALHRFYELRKRTMGLESIHHYDTYVPILSEIKSEYSWQEAVDTVVDSLHPLGSEYCDVLRQGLQGRWCDRYPNQNKQSGAFSYGTYDGLPYILMNYKPQVLNDVFTLTHEAGHSMHTHLSIKHQPYEYYNYTIFVAEVASTFNEQLLTKHLLSQTDDPRRRAYLINNEIDNIRATIVRQTMFAEFEKTAHAMCEAGEPLTLQSFKELYAGLLRDYFGPGFEIDEQLQLECLRIPHFYRAFYVYQYATGLAAAIALSRRVTGGGPQELSDYLGFLSSGCSKYPLELLQDAGVDLCTPEPIQSAMAHFADLVAELETLL